MLFRPIRRVAIILFLSIGLSACASLFGTEPVPTPIGPTFTPEPPTVTPEPMTVIVNGEGITVTEFNAEMQRYINAQQALGKVVHRDEASLVVLDDLISQLLLAQAARANGFILDETALQSRIDALAAQIGGMEALAKWQLDYGYTDQTFRPALKRAMESAWMRDKIIAAVPSTAEQVHVQQILLYNLDKAQNFLTQLNGGADFAELALEADPVTRGDLGWFPKGYLLDPKIEETAFNLPVGQYSDVIVTDVGFHILKVLERDPQHPLSPDAYLVMQEHALQDWLGQQRQQSKIILAPKP